jgi:hypothetical protein
MGVAATGTIQWTQQSRHLWTGRCDDAPIGTIERGARFTYVDTTGDAHRGYRTLLDAQSAATGPIDIRTCGPDAHRRRVHPLLFAAATAMVVVDAALLGGAALLGL